MRTMRKDFTRMKNDIISKDTIKEFYQDTGEEILSRYFELFGLFFEYPEFEDISIRSRQYDTLSKLDLCFEQAIDDAMINAQTVLREVENKKPEVETFTDVCLFSHGTVSVPNDFSWLSRQLKKLSKMSGDQVKAKILKFLLTIQERNLNAMDCEVDEILGYENPSPIWTTGWNSKYAGDYLAGHICYQLGFQLSVGNLISISRNLTIYLKGSGMKWEWNQWTDSDGIDHGGYNIE